MRSLHKDFTHIQKDPTLMLSDIICLNEIWFIENTEIKNFYIENYDIETVIREHG